MQLHEIAHSLKEIASVNPMATALLSVGFNDATGIHYGARASRTAERPFAMIAVVETGREEMSAGVAEVEYEVTLQVVCAELIELAGAILEMFRRYWDRITSLPTLPLDPSGEPMADFVSIHPLPGSEIGESDDPELGRDVILGTTSWTLTLSEHKPSL